MEQTGTTPQQLLDLINSKEFLVEIDGSFFYTVDSSEIVLCVRTQENPDLHGMPIALDKEVYTEIVDMVDKWNAEAAAEGMDVFCNEEGDLRSLIELLKDVIYRADFKAKLRALNE